MIKFFRHIRQRLVSESKFSKYLLYAIGEIILVVIGILIALQINNWNENRKHDVTEKIFFKGIKTDLLEDKKFIKDVLNFIQPKIEVYKILNEEDLKDYSLNRLQIDSLLSIYLFSGQPTFYAVSGSFQSAVAGNEINTFKQKKVTQNIIKLYSSTYDRLVDNGEILDTRWSGLSKIYSSERRTKQFSNLNKKNLSLVLDDIHFHYIQLEWYENLLKNTVVEIEELLHELEE